jgi:hypothetical protein
VGALRAGLGYLGLRDILQRLLPFLKGAKRTSLAISPARLSGFSLAVAARWDFCGTLTAFTLVFVQNAFAASIFVHYMGLINHLY